MTEKLWNMLSNNPTLQVMQGYNCTVFAYGQTGTGKTFTMEVRIAWYSNIVFTKCISRVGTAGMSQE